MKFITDCHENQTGSRMDPLQLTSQLVGGPTVVIRVELWNFWNAYARQELTITVKHMATTNNTLNAYFTD